ncbi:ankyrin repeat domain-containing protein [Vulgatibacter sp.]|uniref:ankyrin repeat domain-containing protein n=1 Tax=Vulgatibacter sp. TaxID=1971226 RepID=UPI003564F26A
MDHRHVVQAVEEGDAANLAVWLEADPELRRARGPDGVSALLRALYRKQEPLVELLLHDGLDIFEAAALGQLEALVRILRQDDVAPRHVSPDGFTALHLAALFGRPVLAQLLISHGADVDARAANECGLRPLHAAVAAGSRPIVEQLLVMGANPNVAQRGGFTPLHDAAAAGHGVIVSLLLERGADREARTDAGETAAALAEKNGHVAVLPLLR